MRGPRPAALRRVVVLGGARSGKSTFAERQASNQPGAVVYLATLVPGDDEMLDRVARHRAQRPASWATVEEPLRLAERASDALRGLPAAQVTVLVEDLTLWLANLFEADAATAEQRASAELDRLLAVPAHLILVSNEVGMGIVPAYPSGRLFRDALGRLNQHAAAACTEAYLLVAGLPLRLK